MDGADALADGQDPLAVDEQAHGGLGDVAAVLFALDQDPVALQGEGGSKVPLSRRTSSSKEASATSKA